MSLSNKRQVKDLALTVPRSLEFVLRSVQDQYHVFLFELSNSAPILVLFLRHFGCLFCREALADIHKVLPSLEAGGVKVALVHMGSDEEASAFLAGYGLAGLSRISSCDQALYKSFGLACAQTKNLFSLATVFRCGEAVLNGHSIGKITGNIFQMPGVFLIYQGRILKTYRHRHVGQRPDYLKIASCSLSDKIC